MSKEIQPSTVMGKPLKPTGKTIVSDSWQDKYKGGPKGSNARQKKYKRLELEHTVPQSLSLAMLHEHYFAPGKEMRFC